MVFRCFRLLVRPALFAPIAGADASRRRSPSTAVAVVLAFVLLATGCSTASNRGAKTPPAAPSPTIGPDPSHPGTAGGSQDVAATGPTLAPARGSPPATIPELRPVIPPPEVAEEVLAVAREAAPRSELSLQDCTDWIADPAISLEPAQAQECAAMLAAAVDTCRKLDCFAAPADTAPADTVAPADTAPADTVAPDQAPAVASTTTSAASTTTRAPTTAAAPTTTLASPTTTAAPTATAPDPDPGPAPEGGHPPLPLAGMVPRQLPYWDYPTCGASPPWPSDCYPPSEWEVPQDLSDCFIPLPDAGVGGMCGSRRPDGPPHQETPRQTRDVVEFITSCQASWHPISCGYLVLQMKWALDYLGAHPWCVLQQYYDRLAAHDDIWNRGAGLPADMANRHGWHLCPTVIDPGQDDDPRRRLSETGISLAEQCRLVLPADVQLEDIPRRISQEPRRFGSDCEAWATWVENRPQARDWRACDRSARLAEEWMEHHYGTPERYFTVTC